MEAGKNLATKEDIEEITKKVEGVKAAFEAERQARENQGRLFLQAQDFKHQMRLAALERRLQAHQEAYALWRRLLGNLHSPEALEVAAECDEWWNNNNLYLSRNARVAFREAYMAVPEYKSLRQEQPDAMTEMEFPRFGGRVNAFALSAPEGSSRS